MLVLLRYGLAHTCGGGYVPGGGKRAHDKRIEELEARIAAMQAALDLLWDLFEGERRDPNFWDSVAGLLGTILGGAVALGAIAGMGAVLLKDILTAPALTDEAAGILYAIVGVSVSDIPREALASEESLWKYLGRQVRERALKMQLRDITDMKARLKDMRDTLERLKKRGTPREYFKAAEPVLGSAIRLARQMGSLRDALSELETDLRGQNVPEHEIQRLLASVRAEQSQEINAAFQELMTSASEVGRKYQGVTELTPQQYKDWITSYLKQQAAVEGVDIEDYIDPDAPPVRPPYK